MQKTITETQEVVIRTVIECDVCGREICNTEDAGQYEIMYFKTRHVCKGCMESYIIPFALEKRQELAVIEEELLNP